MKKALVVVSVFLLLVLANFPLLANLSRDNTILAAPEAPSQGKQYVCGGTNGECPCESPILPGKPT